MLYILLFLLASMLFIMWCCFKVGADFDSVQNCQEKNK